MKKILLLTALLISFIVNAQKIKTIVFYNNGDKIEGFSRKINYDFIKFSSDKKGKYKKIDIKDIDKIIFYHKEGKEEYHHLYVKERKKEDEFFARLVSKGSINYYIYSNKFRSSYTSYKSIDVGNGMVSNTATQKNNNHDINLFYLKREEDKQAVYISDVYYSIFGEKVFRKNAIKFFSNCTELVNKIKSKEYKKSDILEVIEFYNKECK